MGSIPANGLTYFTPTACGCITQVRGFQAMTSAPAPPLVNDKRRLVKGNGKPVDVLAVALGELPKGPVAQDWPKQWRAGHRQTKAVQVGDVAIVAVVHQHRIEARLGAKTLWTFIADGRISAPPVIVGDRVLFGAHDGYVYSVNVKDGALGWKYLLAPAERLICVNGQLESSWPAYGVCLTKSQPPLVIASAGTHAGLAGGVTVAAFDAATGKVAWKKRIEKQPNAIPPGGKGARIVAYSFINSVPRVDGNQITLGDGGRKGGTFSFAMDESEQAINERLASVRKK